MPSQLDQARISSYIERVANVASVEVLEHPFDDLINSKDLRITPSEMPRFSEKNRRLGDPLYKLFGYPSKVYHEDIANFIKAFTSPADVVLDPMAGSGSTGIAALETGRKVILSDASPTASFVSKGLVLQVDIEPLLGIYSELMKKVKGPILSLYRIPCGCSSGCSGQGLIENIYVSDWYKCPSCSHHFPLLNNYAGKRSIYSCPECNHLINIGSPECKSHRVARRQPTVLDILCEGCECGKKRHKRLATQDDLEMIHDNLERFEKGNKEIWFPSARIITDRCYTRKGSWPGFEKGSEVSALFNPTNLWALAFLYRNILGVADPSLKHLMLLTFLGSLIRSSDRMYSTSVVKTYYQVPPVGKVQNVISVFERKFNDLIKAKKRQIAITKRADLAKSVRVYNWDARSLPLPSNSIDYVFLDPPYGGQVPYFELNLFYSSWLRQEERLNEEIVIPMETDEDPHYVDVWAKMITPALQEIYRVLKPNRFFTLMFHSKSSLIWNKLQEILLTRMGENIGFVYKFIHSMERGTTFHINQRNSTNPRTAFLTYQKPSEKTTNNHVGNSGRIDWRQINLERISPLGNRVSLWEVQNEVIVYVHERGIFEVPSTIQIIAKLRNEGWEYDSKSDELVKRG